MIKSQIYPTSFGLNVSVQIVRDTEEDIAYVDVIAPMYINKQWRMGHSYTSSMFSDYQILKDNDFIRVMFSHYPTDKVN